MIFLPFVKSVEVSDKVVAYEDASFDIVPEPEVERAIDSRPDNVPPTRATATGIPVVIEVVIDAPATFVRVTLVGAPPVVSVNDAFASPAVNVSTELAFVEPNTVNEPDLSGVTRTLNEM
jgi:hypothetical protein